MSNRLSSTIGGNWEMDQLYKVSNITRKSKFSHISWHVSNIILKSVKTGNK